MNAPRWRILAVDDDQAQRLFTKTVIEKRWPGALTACGTAQEAMSALLSQSFDALLLDLGLPDMSGTELLSLVAGAHPSMPIIVVSSDDQITTAVHCLRQGAYGYLVKPVTEQGLVDEVEAALLATSNYGEHARLNRHLLDDELEYPEAFAPIVTHSPVMLRIFNYIEAVAPSKRPLLVLGASGTGKELIAAAAHHCSRRSGKLVSVNLAGVDDEHMADTLFGHERGAFSGATDSRAGMIAAAEGGTLFLDEIGDLSAASQVKLLRWLQEDEYYPLGSDSPKRSDVKVILATQQNLRAAVDEGRFRLDLYYRISGHRLELPPLQHRPEDLPALVRHFSALAAKDLGRPAPSYPDSLIPLLAAYPFPGNIRELQAMIMDGVATMDGTQLDLRPIHQAIGMNEGSRAVSNEADLVHFPGQALPTLSQVQELLVDEALRRTDGQQVGAAQLLGISRQALNKRLRNRG
ncbi:MAG: sigma-54 dependent transcriptional regulator [Planctomycetota bacterium]|jgi:DNA-binding NtrC family response regulator|nr:sigma-54 dependent transcriptional regulator [Planctomycetota bacterium]